MLVTFSPQFQKIIRKAKGGHILMEFAGTGIVAELIEAGGAIALAYQSEEHVLQPDAILPVQFYNGRRGDAEFVGLKRLMTAVLLDAIGSYQRNLGAAAVRKQREFQEAERWLLDQSGTNLFSFSHICEVLNIDGESLRRAVLRKRNGIRAEIPPRRMFRRLPQF